MIRSKKKKAKPRKAKPKLTRKERILHQRLRWVKKQFAEADELLGKRNVLYFNCPVSDIKRFPRVRRLLEEARAQVGHWKAELFRLEQLIKHGHYKELD